MVEVIKASNRPAAAMESTRNALIESLNRGFGSLLNTIETKALPKTGD
jgi:hypothetical protein